MLSTSSILWHHSELHILLSLSSRLRREDIKTKLKHRTNNMFSLFYGLWKYMVSKIEFHVLILGIDKAGKTVMHLSNYSILAVCGSKLICNNTSFLFCRLCWRS